MQMKKQISIKKEELGMHGSITIHSYKAGTHAKAEPYVKIFNIAKNAGMEKVARITKLFIDQIYKANETREPVFNTNLIMQGTNTGKDLIVQRLLGINTYTLNLNYGEIGTGAATPTTADTALTTPVARGATSLGITQDIGNNQAQIQYFFTDSSLTNTTYREFGCYVDGTGTLGTGKLFNHSLFTSPYTKSAGTDITCQVNITIN